MIESDVILVDGIPRESYNQIIKKGLEYAIISIPFTYDRMGIPDLVQKIINIAKGKVAEGLFKFFCNNNGITLDTRTCETPFYQADNRDFILNGIEYDIKNNFLYHVNTILTGTSYINLPALVPNRGTWDQWNKRTIKYFSHTTGVGYIFTFLKNLDIYSRNSNFLTLNLTSRQEQYVRELYAVYKGKHQDCAPLSEDDFWTKFRSFGGEINYTVSHYPILIITAYAHVNQWNLFTDSGEGVIKYCNGVLTTVINNKSCEVRNLPSFQSLIPALTNINYGRFKR